jgi:hypothetical protein
MAAVLREGGVGGGATSRPTCVPVREVVVVKVAVP